MNDGRTDGRKPRRGLTIGIVIGLALSVGSGAMAIGDAGRPAAPTAPDPAAAASTDTTPAAPAATGAPTNIDAPDYDGNLLIGGQLTADPGTWTASPGRFSYQWFSCDPVPVACPNIPGADGPDYTVQPTDAGNFIGVEIVAANDSGDSAPTDSLVYGAVESVLPVAESTPTLTGSAQVGQTLSTDGATWTDGSADISYQWYRCDASGSCDSINGANDATYTVTADDVGATIQVGASATNAAGISDEETSAPTAAVTG